MMNNLKLTPSNLVSVQNNPSLDQQQFSFLRGQNIVTFMKKSIFLHISKNTYFKNVSWKFHREILKIDLEPTA